MIIIKTESLIILAIISLLVLSIIGLIVYDRENQKNINNYERIIEQIFVIK